GAHGVIVTGPTIAKAFDDLYYLERACQLQVIALSTGGKLRQLSERVVQEAARGMQEEGQQARLHFEAIRRILNREEPEYATLEFLTRYQRNQTGLSASPSSVLRCFRRCFRHYVGKISINRLQLNLAPSVPFGSKMRSKLL